jgi:nucleoside phosphorylase
LVTGIGQAAMEQVLTWLLDQALLDGVRYRPCLVLSAGFSGSLHVDLQVGDLVLATEVVDREGHRWTAPWPGELPPGRWRSPLHRGRLLSVPAITSDPEAKRTLGQQHQAVAVDMETATVARLCQGRGVPFGCVRAISDDVHTALSPSLVSLLEGGRVVPLRVARELLRSPRLAGELWRLERQTRLAARRLAAALDDLLPLTASTSV